MDESHRGQSEPTEIVVKNTFLNLVDVDDQVWWRSLRRTQSSPVLSSGPHDESDDYNGEPRAQPVGAAAAAAAASLAEAGDRLPGLRIESDSASQSHRIFWRVDAKKLKSTDREHMSPEIVLHLGRPVTFKMVLRPRRVHNEKGGGAFRTAKGIGSVEVKCMERLGACDAPIVSFRIGVGAEEMRGPVTHDFSDRGSSGLPDASKVWHFPKHVDEKTGTFLVLLEISSQSSGAVF